MVGVDDEQVAENPEASVADEEIYGTVSVDPNPPSTSSGGERQQVVVTAALGIAALAGLGLLVMGVKKLISVQAPKMQKVQPVHLLFCSSIGSVSDAKHMMHQPA